MFDQKLILKSLKNSIIGEVTSQMFAISVEFSNSFVNGFCLIFYTYSVPSELTIESISNIEGLIYSDFSELDNIVTQIISHKPDILSKIRGKIVYLRNPTENI